MTNNVDGPQAIFIVCGAAGMSPALKITGIPLITQIRKQKNL
jgi:hypothetical protein